MATDISSGRFEKVMENWRAILLSGEPGGAEARMRRFDGEYRWFLIRARTGSRPAWPHRQMVRNEYGYRGTEASEKELRDLVDYVPQLIVIREPDGSSIYANRATLDYLGCTFEEFFGTRL